MRFSMSILVLLLTVSFGNAQSTISDGYISYSISIDSDQPGASLFAVGSSLEVAFKGYNTKIVAKNAGGSVSFVGDNKSVKGLALIDIMSEKMAIKLGSKDQQKAKEEMAKISDNPIRHTEDTKVIAGYTCQKVFMKDKKSGANIILYITDKIKPKNDDLAKVLIGKIKGFPLGIVVRKDNTTLRLTATTVSTRTPSDGAFSVSVPTGYTVKTIEELEEEAKNKF
jgi:hypothetical protein